MAPRIRRYMPLVLAVIALAVVQIGCTYFVVQAVRECWTELIDIAVSLERR